MKQLQLLAASLLLATSVQASDSDVLVYGATPAGICAAVAAARSGASTTLVEPSKMVGGLMSGGLSFSDSNQCDRTTLKGLFEEIHLRIEKHYTDKGVKLPYAVAVKDQRAWTYEPHVAEKVFNDLLNEAKVKVVLNESLTSLTKDGTHIKSMRTGKDEYTAKTWIDASYEGDLMAAAKVTSVIGREGKKQYGESLAGHQFTKPTIATSPLGDDGKLLPLMTAAEAGKDEGDAFIMPYSWRICMTSDPANMVPFEKPATYDPARFEIARRLLNAGVPARYVAVDIYPIPGNKVDINNGIGRMVSMALIGACREWPEADAAKRAKIWQDHKDYALELIWFLRTDPSVPEAVRKQMSALGYCKDEFADYGYFPPALYVREARRMIGEHVLTQADIRTDVTKPDSIGIGCFPIDSHDCQRVATSDGGWTNEGTIFPVHMKGVKYGQPHQLPYRSILPKRAECDNLLVPVCLSSTHVAFSSVRVEPTWMVLGQSSGIAAAMAAKSGKAMQDVPLAELQTQLKAAGQVLDLKPEHIEGSKAEVKERRG